MTAGSSFRFRLERVRELRERKEDLARRELARAVSRRSRSEDRLRTVEDHLERTRADQLTATTRDGDVSAAELLARQAFLEHVEAQRSMGAVELERREAEVVDRDAELTDAAREHEMLERLKERHRAEHDREAARRESNALDEIALERFRRSAA